MKKKCWNGVEGVGEGVEVASREGGAPERGDGRGGGARGGGAGRGGGGEGGGGGREVCGG